MPTHTATTDNARARTRARARAARATAESRQAGRSRAIALVDGNRLVAEFLPQVLARSARPYVFLGSASRLMELDGLLAGPAADVAIVGNWLPDGRAREAIRRIRAAWPVTRILFLHPDPAPPELLEEVVAAGADSLVSRQAGTPEMLDAIERTAAGQPVLPPDFLGRLARKFGERTPAPRIEGELTPRERASVQALLATGSTERAAQRLGMSPTTCRSHLHRAMRKLDAGSRIGLLGSALRLRVIDPPRVTRLASGHRRLTSRERAVLQSLLDTGGAAPAAARLGLTEATVRSHLHGAMRKMSAATAIDAVRIGLAEGLIQVGA